MRHLVVHSQGSEVESDAEPHCRGAVGLVAQDKTVPGQALGVFPALEVNLRLSKAGGIVVLVALQQDLKLGVSLFQFAPQEKNEASVEVVVLQAEHDGGEGGQAIPFL